MRRKIEIDILLYNFITATFFLVISNNKWKLMNCLCSVCDAPNLYVKTVKKTQLIKISIWFD